MTTLDQKAQAAADKAGQVAFIAKFGGVGSLRIHAALGAGIEAAITAYLDALSSLPAQAADDKARLDWLEQHVVNVRVPLVHGSRDLFWSSPDDSYEGESGPSDLRKQIDALVHRDQVKL